MKQIPDHILFDSRLIERHIAAGLLTREQVNEYLAKAEDAAEHAEHIAVQDLVGGSKLEAAKNQSEPKQGSPSGNGSADGGQIA